MSEKSESSPVNEGDIVAGKYRVERVLGVGGMGVVVAARHVELGELFALKFLLPNFREDPEVARRFAREARTGIRVKNEHVARVFDVGTLPDGAPYMVMEHLTGKDLANVIEKRGRLPLEEAVDLLLQGCEALCDAHSLGIVHRDLKPANLFVIAGSDGLPFVKVLDFGISKLITTAVDDLSATSSAAILGSPLYMSPEQLTSSKDVDRRADIWSLGIILYETLTGRTPFEADSFVGLTSAILGGKFEPASKKRAGIPPAVDALIASMLKVDRAARLPSVEALAQRLAPFGTANARTSSERIARIATRPPVSSEVLDPSSAAPTLDVVAEIPVYTTGVGDRNSATVVPSRSMAPPGQARRKPPMPLIVGAALALAGMGAVGAWMALRPSAPLPSTTNSAAVPSSLAPVATAVPSSVASTTSVAASAPSSVPSSAEPVVASAGPREVPHPPASATIGPAPKVGGASNAATLTRAFTRRETDVARCFDQSADPHGTPKLTIRFTVDVDGHVKAAQISPPDVAATPLGQCLSDVARSTQFGPQTEEVSFRIPIAAR